MGQSRQQQDDRTSRTQELLRALVQLLARSAAREFVATSSTDQTEEDRTDALSPRSRP